MKQNRLGATGLFVTQLGYGSMGLRGPKTWGVRVVEDETAGRMLNLVLDSGINFIDTAPDYGASEERIGKYLGARRHEFVLATKCGCDYRQHEDRLEVIHTWSKEVVERNVTASLRRLRTDYIDILQFHGGDAETLERTGLIELLQSFRRRGLVRFIGVSSSLPEIEALIGLSVFDTFQIPYSCLAPEHDQLIRDVATVGAGIIIRGGIAQGGPDAEIQRPLLNDVWNQAKLDELLQPNMTRAELILRYTLSHPHCHTTIVGTCSQTHLEANLAAAARGELPQALRDEISRRVQRVLTATPKAQ